MDVSGQRCDTGTYSSVPASRCVSSSVTQQVTVACGSSTSRKEVSWWCETGFVRGAFHQIVSWPRRAPGPVGKHRGGAADIGRERQAGDSEIGLPGIRHVAGDVGKAHAFTPVPFVRVDAGVEAACKKRREAIGQRGDSVL